MIFALKTIGIVVFVIIFTFFIIMFFSFISWQSKIDYNNYMYKDNMDCSKCKNKTQFIKMRIFNKSQYHCNICGWSDYWWNV